MVCGSGFISRALLQHPTQATEVLIGSVPTEVADICKLDSIGINLEQELREDDERTQSSLNSSTRWLPDGRYNVDWPCKSVSASLAHNYGLCFGQSTSVTYSLTMQKPIAASDVRGNNAATT
ncbi:hypothetical protein AB6A40_001770 [Gnathostoma spinigerum]|uniref:Uncharacterized protein n=1 Tax=Gnathostoma spinigerum TaxID=75299 RepID=A0ABD6E7D1_9BILA